MCVMYMGVARVRFFVLLQRGVVLFKNTHTHTHAHKHAHTHIHTHTLGDSGLKMCVFFYNLEITIFIVTKEIMKKKTIIRDENRVEHQLTKFVRIFSVSYRKSLKSLAYTLGLGTCGKKSRLFLCLVQKTTFFYIIIIQNINPYSTQEIFTQAILLIEI